MLVISNHILNEVGWVTDKLVVRVNMAWVKSKDSLRLILSSLKNHKIFLDYPEGRTKPPKPALKMSAAIEMMKEYQHIAYFAVSNAENPFFFQKLRETVPMEVQLVPKIETKTGVENMTLIAGSAKTNLVMLDKEDLYTNVSANQEEYEKLVKKARSVGKERGIKVIELEGVVFREHQEPRWK